MSASVAMKPGLSQRVYDWLVSLFWSERVQAPGAGYSHRRAMAAAMPVMGRAIPDYELAEVEIVRPVSKATAVGNAIAAAGVPESRGDKLTLADALAELAIELPIAVAAVPEANAPVFAARLGAVAALNKRACRATALSRTMAPAIKVERRKALRRHDVATPRPVVVMRRAKPSGERRTGHAATRSVRSPR